jgi:hypothetical protein
MPLNRSVRVMSLLGLALPFAAGAAQQQPDSSRAAPPGRTSFWLGAQADLVGLQGGPSGSPALFGGNAMLARKLGTSPWEAALVLSAASRRRDAPTPQEPAYEASTYGLGAEIRYLVGGRVYGPYLVAGIALANTRVDDRLAGFVPGVGTDATTGVLGGGAGLRFRMLRVTSYAEVQYQVRTTATHGRHAVPVRVGFRL